LHDPSISNVLYQEENNLGMTIAKNLMEKASKLGSIFRLHPGICLRSKKMSKETRSNVWIIMLILSTIFLMWTLPLLLLSGGQVILEEGLKYAGSSFDIESLDKAALGYINMSMLKPLWEEIWIGILGIYCALGLRGTKKSIWWLSLFWGIMLIINAIIQGGYEVVILNWSSACLQTYLFLVLGIIAAASLLITSKNYFHNVAYGKSGFKSNASSI